MRASILIVEDDLGIVTLAKRVLQRDPELTVVETVRSGEEAIEVARAGRPDVVIMDLTLPGMDGLEATRRLKAERPVTKVIILTGRRVEGPQRAAGESGADAFLHKRNLLRDLLPTIQRVLGERTENGT